MRKCGFGGVIGEDGTESTLRGGIGDGVEVEGRRVGGCVVGARGKACTTSHTPCSTATHHISPLPVVNPEGKEYMEGLGSTIGRTLWRGMAGRLHLPAPPHTTIIPPLPVPCLRPGPPPAIGKEYGGIRSLGGTEG